MVVAGVLLMHVWLLDSGRLLFSIRPDVDPHPKPFMTRQIDAPSRQSKSTPAVQRTKKTAIAQSQPETLASTSVDPTLPNPGMPVEQGNVGAAFSEPATLPPRDVEAVDLPSDNRPASEFTAAEITAYKAPASARMKYAIKGFSRGMQYAAGGDLNWRQDGQTYEARMEVGAFLLGTRVQTSVGTLGTEGLMPSRFGD